MTHTGTDSASPGTEPVRPAADTRTTGVSVVLPPVLAALAGDRRVLQVPLPDGASVGEVLDVLATDFPVFGRRVRDETGAVRRHVNLFVDGEDIRGLDGAATTIRPGQELLIIQSVAGG